MTSGGSCNQNGALDPLYRRPQQQARLHDSIGSMWSDFMEFLGQSTPIGVLSL